MSEFTVQPKSEMKLYLKDNVKTKDLFYVAVKIKGAKKVELIVNSAHELENKLEYFDQAYDDKLARKHADVKITDYGVIKVGTELHNQIKDFY